MINYTKRNVFIITLTITILIYVFISVIWIRPNKNETANYTQEEVTVESTQEEVIVQDTQENIEPNENKKHIWQIQIPKIDLIADIEEGTTQKVMSKYVGHFSKTSMLNGNVGLAAHNRGFVVASYFKNIKNLDLGDEIIYQKDEEIKKYEVIENTIIDETDWTYLEETNDNRITLITCVENQPQFRRCVQATEVI